MSKYTKGPWVFGDWLRRKQGATCGAGWVEVWSEFDPENCLPIIACKHHDQMANARLIAAAPELFEALILMVRTRDEPAESLLQEVREQQWLSQARAAIAKATGEQS